MRGSYVRVWIAIWAVAAAIGGLGATLGAQGAVAELRGRVVDESGAALPGATLTVTHRETGIVRTTVSSETGAFVVPALQVGAYDVRVELSGFSTLTQQNLRLGVGESANVTFTLNLATVQETVTVSGETPLVDVKQSSIAGRVGTMQVEALPLNGRNWLDLVALVPGARGNPGTIQAGASGSDMAKYNVDGVDITNQCCAGANTGYSQENIAEFQVLTNRFDAEHGRVNGAVINAVTKSGTNQVRATGFGYFRNDKFDAKNPFTGVVSPFDEKQVGFNGGGPIVRDRAHFFASYEFQDRAITSRPNTGYAQFDVDVPQDVTRHYVTGRADVQLNQKHRLFVRGSMYNWDQINVDVDSRTTISGGYSRPSDNIDVSIGETWVVSPRTLYEVRAGFSRIDNRLNSNSPTPRLNFPSAILGSPTNSPQWWKEMNTQINQSISYFVPDLKGEHSMKAGLQIFFPHFWGAFPQPAYGSYNFSRDPADFNDPSTYPAPTSYTIPLGDTSYKVSNPIYAAYFQDNWTVAPRLTLNLGLRYDLETGTTNKDREHPAEPGERNNDIDNLAPRVGFAYDLTGSGRSILRGGYGRYYDKVMLNLTSNERRVIEGQIINVTVPNPVVGDPLGGLTYEDYKARNIPASTIVIALDYQTPVNEQVSLGLAQQIGERYGFQADIVYAKGRDEPMVVDTNFFQDPATGLPRNPTIYGYRDPRYTRIQRTQSTGKSEYAALQTGFNARPVGEGWFNRLQFQGSYTLSKTKDNHTSNRGGTPTNPFDLDAEWADSQQDQRHRFTTNVIVPLPFDIRMSAIYFLGSERVINVATTLDPFRLGYTGRWLDDAGNILPRNSERTEKWDKKLDIRLSKVLRVNRVSFEGIVDVFNVLNTWNLTNYGTNYYGATYLRPANSTNIFYQPRQVQLGFRVTY
jgi:hypothetical protein